jgi:hypothetical protein
MLDKKGFMPFIDYGYMVGSLGLEGLRKGLLSSLLFLYLWLKVSLSFTLAEIPIKILYSGLGQKH